MYIVHRFTVCVVWSTADTHTYTHACTHAHPIAHTHTHTRTHTHTMSHIYRILLSKRPSPCKRPRPLFDDPMVHVYMRYTYQWLVCISAHPRFFGPSISSAHGRLLERIRYMHVTTMYVLLFLSQAYWSAKEQDSPPLLHVNWQPSELSS